MAKCFVAVKCGKTMGKCFVAVGDDYYFCCNFAKPTGFSNIKGSSINDVLHSLEIL